MQEDGQALLAEALRDLPKVLLVFWTGGKS